MTNVESGSAADSAGIRPGDVISLINNRQASRSIIVTHCNTTQNHCKIFVLSMYVIDAFFQDISTGELGEGQIALVRG